MNDLTIEQWLGELASDAPAPGGGAAAALEVAMGAALVEMVCNLTIGKPAYAQHEDDVRAILDRASPIRRDALGLAAEDAAAFTAVIGAYRLPKSTSEEIEARATQVQTALAAAADVPRRTAQAAITVLDLAEALAPIGNVNVISDAAVAAGAARGALQAARLNIDANRSSIEDPGLRDELAAANERIDRNLLRADEIVAAVRLRMDA
jgi:methenyltetrahydrofolate cyclohydrolase